jgi:hypothetical protein
MKKLAVCGCSFMTSSHQDWELFKGADWPKEFPITDDDFSQLPVFIKQELKRFNYIHWSSFLDLYAKHKNFEITYLSERGCNNLDIRVQVDRAIKLSADYVILSATDWGRDILKKPKHILDNDDSLAYKMYLTELYDSDAKKINDYYVLQSGLESLEKHSIPYVFITNLMKDLDWNEYNIWPIDKEQPWDKPFVTNIWNHVAFKDHEEMYKTLLELTEKW